MKTLSKILLSTLLFSAVMSSDGYGMAPVPNNGDSKTTKKNLKTVKVVLLLLILQMMKIVMICCLIIALILSIRLREKVI